MKPVLSCAVLVASLGVAWAATAAEGEKQPEGWEFVDMPETEPAETEAAPEPDDEREAPGYVPGYRRSIGLGLSPHAPQALSALPGGITPAYGAPVPSREYRFGFSGYLQQPLRMSLGKRDHAYENQQRITLHGDPTVAGGSWGWFDHTFTVPAPWAHLRFTYGNEAVQATSTIGAWNMAESDSATDSFMPQAQVWIDDAYLTFHPPLYDPITMELRIGAYRDRYGAMAEYTEGAYGAPLIGAITGVGATASVRVPFEYALDLHLEAGFKGELSKPPSGMVQDGSNEHARAIEGSTLAAHGHAGLGIADNAAIATVHYIRSWSQDDRADPLDDPDTTLDESREGPMSPDGRITIVGGDVRVNGGRFGYVYLGAARTQAVDAVRVSDLVKVLNAGSGKDLMERYWGFESNGTGKLTLVGGQYGLSLGTLLRHPMEFYGDGPDLHVGLFGIYGKVQSPITEFDDQRMYKFGTELTYSMLPWLAASGRFDRVVPDTSDSKRSFAVLAPKLVFRTDWKAREALTLQYATYFLGSHVRVEGDQRLVNTPSGKPDRHLLSLCATMWW